MMARQPLDYIDVTGDYSHPEFQKEFSIKKITFSKNKIVGNYRLINNQLIKIQWLYGLMYILVLFTDLVERPLFRIKLQSGCRATGKMWANKYFNLDSAQHVTEFSKNMVITSTLASMVLNRYKHIECFRKISWPIVGAGIHFEGLRTGCIVRKGQMCWVEIGKKANSNPKCLSTRSSGLAFLATCCTTSEQRDNNNIKQYKALK